MQETASPEGSLGELCPDLEQPRFVAWLAGGGPRGCTAQQGPRGAQGVSQAVPRLGAAALPCPAGHTEPALPGALPACQGLSGAQARGGFG